MSNQVTTLDACTHTINMLCTFCDVLIVPTSWNSHTNLPPSQAKSSNLEICSLSAKSEHDTNTTAGAASHSLSGPLLCDGLSYNSLSESFHDFRMRLSASIQSSKHVGGA